MNFNGRYILDARGDPQPCDDLIEWAMWFETSGAVRQQVALDLIGPYTVSTIFLGIDYNWSPMTDPLTYQPVLWETMVFAGPESPIAMRRYDSREAALSGHQEFVNLVAIKNGYEEGSIVPHDELLDRVAKDADAQKENENPDH